MSTIKPDEHAVSPGGAKPSPLVALLFYAPALIGFGYLAFDLLPTRREFLAKLWPLVPSHVIFLVCLGLAGFVLLPLLIGHWTYRSWRKVKRGEQAINGKFGWVPTPVICLIVVGSVPFIFPTGSLLVLAGAVYLMNRWKKAEHPPTGAAQPDLLAAGTVPRKGLRSMLRLEMFLLLAAVAFFPVVERDNPYAWCGFGGGGPRSYIRAYELVWPLLTGNIDRAIPKWEPLTIAPGGGSSF